jgi:regulator of sirC expression with transglutaminase-like and TPR domain
MSPHEEDGHDDLSRFENPQEALQYLRLCGIAQDTEIDLSSAALALSLVFLPGLPPGRYRSHIARLKTQVADEFAGRVRQGTPDTLESRAATLRKVLHEAHGYEGDDKTFDDIQNASLIRVIERRKGMPVAMGLLYVIVARAQGWAIDGLNFPGHFIVRLEKDGERLILDPFRRGAALDAAGLRRLLKAVVGDKAELSHDYYNPSSNRGMLIRLQNNIKNRLIEGEDYAQALLVIDTMEALAPDEYRLLFDKAVLYLKLGQNPQAAHALERYIEKCPDPRERRQASDLLGQIR